MRICPFCLNKIESTEVDYLFEDEFSDWDFLGGMRNLEDFPLNAREDKKYIAFRKQKKLAVTDRADTTRVFVRKEELYSLITQLREYCGSEDNGEVWIDNQIDEQFEFEDGEILKIRYRNQENEDSILDVSSEITTRRASMICQHCHNILPSGFFQYQQVTIGLIGKKDAGKTCMLVSMLASHRKALNGSSEVLSFEEAQTIQDPSYRELREKVRLLEENGICPDSTRGEFIPPVILKASWHDEGIEDPFMVCVYDAAGELLENSAQNGSVLNNILSTDGWIYLIDPQNTKLGSMIETLSDRGRSRILNKARIRDINRQRKMQQSNCGGWKVREIMQDLLTDINTTAQNRNFCDDLLQFLWTKQAGFTSRKPEMAFVLSKSDEVMQFLNGKYGEWALFDRDIHYLSPEGSEAYRDREEKIREIFQDYVIDSDDMNTYGNIYLASALGCPTKQKNINGTMIYKLDGKYDPIRIGEAFVRTTMALIEKKAGREDEE